MNKSVNLPPGETLLLQGSGGANTFKWCSKHLSFSSLRCSEH